jgi:hypothetical protein
VKAARKKRDIYGNLVRVIAGLHALTNTTTRDGRSSYPSLQFLGGVHLRPNSADLRYDLFAQPSDSPLGPLKRAPDNLPPMR